MAVHVHRGDRFVRIDQTHKLLRIIRRVVYNEHAGGVVDDFFVIHEKTTARQARGQPEEELGFQVRFSMRRGRHDSFAGYNCLE